MLPHGISLPYLPQISIRLRMWGVSYKPLQFSVHTKVWRGVNTWMFCYVLIDTVQHGSERVTASSPPQLPRPLAAELQQVIK